MKAQNTDPMWNDDPSSKPVSFKQIICATVAIVAVVLVCAAGWKTVSPAGESKPAASIPATSFR